MAAVAGLVAELDVPFSSPEEFGEMALAWLVGGAKELAGELSEEILAGPPLQPIRQRVPVEEHPDFFKEPPPLWGR